MKKASILCMSFFSIIFILNACGKKETAQTGEITVVTSFGEEDGNRGVYESLMKEYEDKYGIRIADESHKSDNSWKNEVLERFEKGEEPDVLFFFSGKVAEPIVAADKVVPIDVIRTEYPDYACNINATVLKSMESADGKRYAIPVTGFWESMFINKDLFEQYEVEIPIEWEQWITAVNTFKKNKIVPLAASLSDIPHYLFEFFIYNYTGPAEHLASIPTDAEKLPESWIKGLRLFNEAYKMGAFPKSVNHMTDDEAFQMFQNKKAAMYVSGSWTVGNIKDTENVVVINFPSMRGEARKSTDMIAGFSMGFYITKKAWENPERKAAAVNFVSSMTSNEAIAKFNEGVSAPSITSKTSTQATTPLMQSVFDINDSSTAYIGAVQDHFNEEAQRELFGKIPGIAEGKVTPEEALREFIKTMTGETSNYE